VEKIKVAVLCGKEAGLTVVAAMDNVNRGTGEHDARVTGHTAVNEAAR
jgi:hypothetical protein